METKKPSETQLSTLTRDQRRLYDIFGVIDPKLPFSENLIRPHDYINDQPSLTDQSDLQSSDINYIMAQYAKTGLLPVSDELRGLYQDNTDLPSLEESFNIVKHAENLFMELPAQVRKAMDNDPSQLENFISDANNRDFLVKHGIILDKKEEPKSPPQSSSATEPIKTTEK